MQDLFTSFSVIVAAASVVVGVVYYSFYLRSLGRVRRVDLFMRFVALLDTEEFMNADLQVLTLEFTDYADFERKYGSFSKNAPIHRAIRMVCNYFEAIGFLLYRGWIDKEMVWDVFTLKPRWEKMRPIVLVMREEMQDPRYLEWFEWLYNWYVKYEKHPNTRHEPIYERDN